MPSRVDELKMMQEPNRWPRWPLLPVKKKEWDVGRMERPTGVLFADRQPVVYLINMYAVTSQDALREAEKITYNDFDSLVDAGWIVD